MYRLQTDMYLAEGQGGYGRKANLAACHKPPKGCRPSCTTSISYFTPRNFTYSASACFLRIGAILPPPGGKLWQEPEIKRGRGGHLP